MRTRPLAEVSSRELRPLLQEEAEHWKRELLWDFGEVSAAVAGGLDRRTLGGLVLQDTWLFEGTIPCRSSGQHGFTVRVCAALETVSTARTGDALRLARACYHLGNRHVALQVGDGWVRYLPDHVLDDMVRGLGLTVREEPARFEPERGAYAGQPPALHSHPHGDDAHAPPAHDHPHGHRH